MTHHSGRLRYEVVVFVSEQMLRLRMDKGDWTCDVWREVR